MHQLFGMGDCRAHGLRDGLVSKADPEQGLAGREHRSNDRNADPRRRGSARTRGQQHGVVVGDDGCRVGHRKRVVSQNCRLGTQLH